MHYSFRIFPAHPQLITDRVLSSDGPFRVRAPSSRGPAYIARNGAGQFIVIDFDYHRFGCTLDKVNSIAAADTQTFNDYAINLVKRGDGVAPIEGEPKPWVRARALAGTGLRSVDAASMGASHGKEWNRKFEVYAQTADPEWFARISIPVGLCNNTFLGLFAQRASRLKVNPEYSVQRCTRQATEAMLGDELSKDNDPIKVEPYKTHGGQTAWRKAANDKIKWTEVNHWAIKSKLGGYLIASLDVHQLHSGAPEIVRIDLAKVALEETRNLKVRLACESQLSRDKDWVVRADPHADARLLIAKNDDGDTIMTRITSKTMTNTGEASLVYQWLRKQKAPRRNVQFRTLKLTSENFSPELQERLKGEQLCSVARGYSIAGVTKGAALRSCREVPNTHYLATAMYACASAHDPSLVTVIEGLRNHLDAEYLSRFVKRARAARWLPSIECSRVADESLISKDISKDDLEEGQIFRVFRIPSEGMISPWPKDVPSEQGSRSYLGKGEFGFYILQVPSDQVHDRMSDRLRAKITHVEKVMMDAVEGEADQEEEVKQEEEAKQDPVADNTWVDPNPYAGMDPFVSPTLGKPAMAAEDLTAGEGLFYLTPYGFVLGCQDTPPAREPCKATKVEKAMTEEVPNYYQVGGVYQVYDVREAWSRNLDHLPPKQRRLILPYWGEALAYIARAGNKGRGGFSSTTSDFRKAIRVLSRALCNTMGDNPKLKRITALKTADYLEECADKLRAEAKVWEALAPLQPPQEPLSQQ